MEGEGGMHKGSSHNSCLFCTTLVIPRTATTTIINEDKDGKSVTVTVKTEDVVKGSESGFILSDRRAEEDVPILKDLKAIFIIRKLLDLPEEQCEQYLQRKLEDCPRPGSWFEVCVKCNEVVKECYQTYRQIIRLEGSLRGIKIQLVNLMRDTNTNGQKRRTEGLLVDDIRTSVLDLSDGAQVVSTEEVKIDSGASQLLPSEPEKPRRKRKIVRPLGSDTIPFDLPDVDDYNAQWCATSPVSVADDSDDSYWSTVKKHEVCEGPVPEKQFRRRRSQRNSEIVLPVPTREENNGNNYSSGIAVPGENEDTKKFKMVRTIIRVDRESDNRKGAKLQILRYKYKCMQCPATSFSSIRIRKHGKLHSDGSGVECRHCGWLIDEGKLKFHLSNYHKSEVDASKTQVIEQEIPYYCDHCHMIYTSERLLQNHHRRNHSHKLLAACAKCSSEFTSKQLLVIHIKKEHPELKEESNDINEIKSIENAKYNCPHCSVSLISKLMMDFHIAKVHPLTLLKCKVCDYQGKWYSDYEHHIAKKHGDERMVCHVCSKELIDRESLKSHMHLYHYKELGLDVLKCPRSDCNSVFTCPAALGSHVQHVHEKVKELCCEHCGKAFSRNSDLKKHVLLHTVPRDLQYKKGPFICEYCPSAIFNVRQGLYYHMKKEHSDKYLFRCEKCGMGYAKRSTLFQHEKGCKGKGNS